MADVTIGIIENGPYIVTGPVELKDGDGNIYPAKQRMALCRCGASTTKPFCDGTHSRSLSGRRAGRSRFTPNAEKRKDEDGAQT